MKHNRLVKGLASLVGAGALTVGTASCGPTLYATGVAKGNPALAAWGSGLTLLEAADRVNGGNKSDDGPGGEMINGVYYHYAKIIQPGVVGYKDKSTQEHNRLARERNKAIWNLKVAQDKQNREREIQHPGGITYVDPTFGDVHICSYNYYMDLDGNGLFDYPDEYIGLSDTFRTDEKITVSMVGNKNMNYFINNVGYTLYDGSGRIVESFQSESAVYNHDQTEEERKVTLEKNYVNELNPGRYQAVWRLDDKIVGSLQFKVVEK